MLVGDRTHHRSQVYDVKTDNNSEVEFDTADR